jgi:hypothetical protein
VVGSRNRPIFFIGDGLTSDSNAGFFDGEQQSFIVPSGATRLFLGTVDGEGWYNNTGSFSVDTSISSKPFDACGDPATPAGITATDALLVLRSGRRNRELPDVHLRRRCVG